MNLILIGFMGSGKTTVGKVLSRELNWKFADTDEIIEKKIKMPIKKIFSLYGEYFFRKLERNILLNINIKEPFILSTGGGMPCFKDNIDIMKKKGIVIYLKAPKSRLFKIDKKNRPLLKKAKILINKRKYCYQKADYIIENYKIDLCIKQLKQLVR
ncbi:shikimate kinase [Desulfurella acetivorans A63]|nr:shikimate kinase [Desulfurella acetivorans A63]